MTAKIGRVLGEVCNWKDGKILDKEMTMYYIVIMTLKLVWDEWNRELIKKHGVAVNEVEEVYKAKIVVRESYLGRRLILGKTRRGRLLTIIVSLVKQKEAYVYPSYSGLQIEEAAKLIRWVYTDAN